MRPRKVYNEVLVKDSYPTIAPSKLVRKTSDGSKFNKHLDARGVAVALGSPGVG